MKKAWLAALCSGLVIPGLGQILNQQLKKGVVLLGAVFVLFVAAVFALYRMVSGALEGAGGPVGLEGGFISRLESQDSTLLIVILLLFLLVWTYGVIDAFVTGARLDRNSEEN